MTWTQGRQAEFTLALRDIYFGLLKDLQSKGKMMGKVSSHMEVWGSHYGLYICCLYICCCQSLSHAQLFVSPWTTARQASLSFTISWSLLKLMSIESVIHPTISSSGNPFSSSPQSFPESGSFLMSELFASGSQSIGASASVFPMNVQD